MVLYSGAIIPRQLSIITIASCILFVAFLYCSFGPQGTIKPGENKNRCIRIIYHKPHSAIIYIILCTRAKCLQETTSKNCPFCYLFTVHQAHMNKYLMQKGILHCILPVKDVKCRPKGDRTALLQSLTLSKKGWNTTMTPFWLILFTFCQ